MRPTEGESNEYFVQRGESRREVWHTDFERWSMFVIPLFGTMNRFSIFLIAIVHTYIVTAVLCVFSRRTVDKQLQVCVS